MVNHAQSSLLQLRRRIEGVERELEKACPDLWAERALLQRLIRTRESGDVPPFDKVRSIGKAIELCLDHTGQWMSKTQLEEMIVGGGYPVDPETAKGLIRDTLNYHVKKGRIVRDGDLFGRKAWVATDDS